MFLYAEAAARGWVNAPADSAYKVAVKESFEWLYANADSSKAVADTDFVNYFANNPGADYTANAGSTPLSKAQFLAFQKYIANCCIDPLESYADQRRLNFLPVTVGGAAYISANPSKISNSLPLRVLYPQSEYTTNNANVMKEDG